MGSVKRILIIDDEPTALEVLEKILEMEGYEVVRASSGREGVIIFEQNPCDLVITDMVMPGQDGLQTILELRNVEPDLPIIAMSGGGAISKERYLAVAGYLHGVLTIAKPFTVKDVAEAVAKLLTQKGFEDFD